MKYLYLSVLMFYALIAVAQTLPGTKVTDSRTGKQVAFSTIVKPGRVTLVTFWGTWCAHGKHQVNAIAAMLPEWRRQVDFDFVAIAEDQAGTEKLVTKYIVSNKWTFPCYTDANAGLKPLLQFYALPYTVVINKYGSVVYRHTGFERSEMLLGAIKAANRRKF